MKLRHLALWTVVPLVGGVALLYGGLVFADIWLRFAVEHHFFGFSASTALAINDYFTWGVVAFAVGSLVGCLLRRQPIVAAVATCSAGLLTWVALTRSHGQTFLQVLSEYAPPIISSFSFATLGALLAARILRPDTSLEQAREVLSSTAHDVTQGPRNH